MKKLISLILVIILVFTLTGCNGQNKDESSSGQMAQVMQIIVGIQSDGKSLDPHVVTDAASMRLIENMYSTLVRYKDGTYGEIEPDLAKEYSISDDGKVYTFILNENVKFHNSDKIVNSEDVKYSIERIISNEVRANQFEMVESIETPDDTKVIINLKDAVSPFLTYLANPMNAIVNKEVVEKEGLDFADGGCGPFILESWEKDQQLTLIKNADYFIEGLPKLDKVIYKPIPDETSRVIALQNKEIDFLLDITNKDVEQLKTNEDIIIDSVPGTFWEYVGINTEKEPLNNVKVRQAVAHAIDREEINQVVKFGKATVLDGGLLPPGHWAYADLHLYPKRDIEKAKSLLKEAGFENGITLQLKVGSDFQYQVDAAQIIKQQLQEAGITVEVLAQESGIFFEGLGAHDFQLAIVGWLGFVDPDEFLYNIFYTDGTYNQQGYSNPQLDKLLDKGRRETDIQERANIYKQAQEIISTDAPMAFLYMNECTCAYLKHVKGYDTNPMVTTLSLRKAYIE